MRNLKYKTKKHNKNQAYTYREQSGGYQRGRSGGAVEGMGEWVKTFSYKIKKS